MKKNGKRFLALFLSAALAAGALTGCGFNSVGGEQEDKSDTEKSLNVLIWDSTYPESVFENFQEETGIKVNVSYITDTNEELTKLVDGSNHYDYVDIESAYVKSFVDNDILKELDYGQIPNAAGIDERYKGAEGDEEGKYTTPASSFFYTYLVYNTETCPIEITKVQDLADPALDGQVCLISSGISLYGMALTALGYPADSTDESQISEASDLLKEIKKNVISFAGASAMSQLENGDCSVALCWDYPALMLDPANYDKYAVATISTGYEQSNGYIGIPKNAEHEKNALKFMNYLYSPEVQASICTDEMVGGNSPLLTKEAMSGVLDDSYYDSPTVQANDRYYDSAWHISITDEQMSLIDTYYTELMSE